MRQLFGALLVVWGLGVFAALGLAPAAAATVEAKVVAAILGVALVAAGAWLRQRPDSGAAPAPAPPAEYGRELSAWGMVSGAVLFFGGFAVGLVSLFFGAAEWQAGLLVVATLVGGWVVLWALGRLFGLRMRRPKAAVPVAPPAAAVPPPWEPVPALPRCRRCGATLVLRTYTHCPECLAPLAEPAPAPAGPVAPERLTTEERRTVVGNSALLGGLSAVMFVMAWQSGALKTDLRKAPDDPAGWVVVTRNRASGEERVRPATHVDMFFARYDPLITAVAFAVPAGLATLALVQGVAGRRTALTRLVLWGSRAERM
jgi:hypothetical protein